MTDAPIAPNENGWGARLKLRLSAILWFVLGLAFLLALPVLLDVSVLVVVGLAVLALLLAFPAAWLVRRLFFGQRRQRWWTSYLMAFVALFFAIAAIVAAPIYYLALRADLQPLVVPQATLSNGSKTVVFQGMVHIGSEGFYKSVVYDLEKALTDGYIIYYEGVRSDPAGEEWFSKTLAGGGDLSDHYKQFGSACGLTFQLDYFGLLQADMKVHPERHVAADVTTADMMREYQRLMDTDPEFARSVSSEAKPASGAGEGDGMAKIFDLIAEASPSQRELVGTACRGWLSMMLNIDATTSEMDRVVVDFRNQKLVERINADNHEKIYMTYGAGHLRGLLALLQTNDPAWNIKSLKWMRVIEAPEDLKGQL